MPTQGFHLNCGIFQTTFLHVLNNCIAQLPGTPLQKTKVNQENHILNVKNL
jgi:hypothetical protein